MVTLIPISDLVNKHGYDLQSGSSSDSVYDPTGQTAYGADGNKIGKVREALADPTTGKLRALVVDVGGWFSSKEVVVPVGLARIEDDGVYFDTLTKDQVSQLSDYADDSYSDNARMSDEQVLRGASYTNPVTGTTTDVLADTDLDTGTTAVIAGTVADASLGTAPTNAAVNTSSVPAAATTATTATSSYNDNDPLYKTPGRLQLLEERLSVNKDKYSAGSVEIGKHVETTQQQISVPLTHEEVVIERHAVSGSQPVSGNVQLGSDSQTIKVDVEAERANVQKQAYVTEEVDVSKRSETQTQTYTESVGREVLDVNKTGDVDVTGTGTTTGTNSTTTGSGDKSNGKTDRNNKR